MFRYRDEDFEELLGIVERAVRDYELKTLNCSRLRRR